MRETSCCRFRPALPLLRTRDRLSRWRRLVSRVVFNYDRDVHLYFEFALDSRYSKPIAANLRISIVVTDFLVGPVPQAVYFGKQRRSKLRGSLRSPHPTDSSSKQSAIFGDAGSGSFPGAIERLLRVPERPSYIGSRGEFGVGLGEENRDLNAMILKMKRTGGTAGCRSRTLVYENPPRPA